MRTLIVIIGCVILAVVPAWCESTGSSVDGLSIVADQLLRPSGTGSSTFDFNVYLVNEGDRPVSVILGSAVSESVGADGALFVAAPPRRIDGSLVKPSSIEIGVTELKPGEVVFLRHVQISSPKRPQIQFMYSVTDSMRQFYDVWIGDCRCIVTLKSNR